VSFQAALRPDAPALVSGDRTLSYQDLDARSGDLAAKLRALGVGPEVVVAICLPRSLSNVVAALAVLKAGGAYLPLDPADPDGRLAFLIEDAQVPVLITGRSGKIQAPPGLGTVIALDDDGRPDESSRARNHAILESAATPKNLAYVIYTSGSTGQPKGVEITRASLLNLVNWHLHAFKVTAADRATQLARVSFDAAVWETWPYLATGASLHLPPEELLNDPESLRNWLVTQRITVSFVPTPLAERLLAFPWPSETALRVMLTGGDTLHCHPSAELPFMLVNNYGPTECTVVATSSLVPPRRGEDGLPPIGLPIADTQVYILDESLDDVPAGTRGELYIGGAGVARGYRNRPQLTLERFIPNPFSADPAERLFKTGDLAQYLPDGQIAFWGRQDEQVKVRGFRIELQEIAAALNSHPSVAQGTVVARDAASGERRLVAYLVARPESRPAVNELREFLAARLPDYMVPATFVALKALPLTPNGKVNRNTLPPPDDANTLRDDDFKAPGTEVERTLAALLAPLLGVERVGVEDNFFTVGGHSLLGAQLIVRVRDAFGVELPLLMVFEAPTVRQLAAEIERLLLAQLEAMSDDDAQSILNSDGVV
jgi:amino acid adenylation domain-containing protein